MINTAYTNAINQLLNRPEEPTNKPAIYFDMDGTLADLYNVPDWLSKLTQSDVTPYVDATPIGNPEELKRVLNGLKKRGYHLGIVSWTAKGATSQYSRATRRAKIEWLNRHYPNVFEEVHVVKYGTPKKRVTRFKRSILVDDNEEVRTKWGTRTIDATDFQNILKNLKILLDISAPNRNTVFTG